ncbi:hypothetical protein niasHS_009090 [Heterodera schachtii]|uniref:Glutathione synthetase n=1 Tax=Heterodera schachtii TaxID=97005 RepID=A0ABD2J9B9_HETSC
MAKFNFAFGSALLVVLFEICCVNFADATQPNEDDNEAKDQLLAIGAFELKRMAQYAIEWCHNNALILRRKGDEGNRGDAALFPPLTLFPSPFPRDAFEQALKAQKAMNLLYFRVARDYEFLMNAYKDVIKGDEHIAKLVDILKKVHEEGIRQPITVMLQRADYLLDLVGNNETNEVKYEPKQVEVNTGAIGATGLKRRTTEFHRRMLKKSTGMDATTANIPDNKPDAALIDTFYMAWRKFDDPKAIMVCLIYSNDPFQYDLRYIAEELEKKSSGKMEVEIYSLADYSERENSTKRLQLDPEDFSLRLDGRKVAIVYSGQSALGCKFDELGMEFRQIIELSTAIKAPSLAVAISSSKKVQQMLAMPGAIERFFPEPSDAATVTQIRATFAKIWGLENLDDDTQKLIEDAIANPGNYVLKPNRECGGHNYYDDKLVEKLKEFKQTERGAHILMQKLRPMVVKNYVLRPYEATRLEEVIPELGVYGFLIGDLKAGKVLHNVQQGYHFRTKLSHVNEAGISAGFGFYDSVYLY